MLSPINRDLNLTYGQLAKLLSELGYSTLQAAGGHIVYEHPKSNSIIAVQRAGKKETVPELVAAAAFRNVVSSNIADEAKLKKLTEQL